MKAAPISTPGLAAASVPSGTCSLARHITPPPPTRRRPPYSRPVAVASPVVFAPSVVSAIKSKEDTAHDAPALARGRSQCGCVIEVPDLSRLCLSLGIEPRTKVQAMNLPRAELGHGCGWWAVVGIGLPLTHTQRPVRRMLNLLPKQASRPPAPPPQVGPDLWWW